MDRLALLETPSGFALFIIEESVFTYPDAIWSWLADVKKARRVARVIEYIKVEDKSVTRRNDGPGEELSKLIKKVCRIGNGKEFYVEDKKLRRVIYSDLIDEKFILHAAGLYRCHTMLRTTGKDLRKACKHYVPGFSDLIEDNKLYAEVMAKILTPGLEPDWDFTQKFEEEMALKLKAADAAAEDARKKVGYQMYHFLFATFLNLRDLPDITEKAVQFINSLAKERSTRQKLHIAEKRNHSDLIIESSEVAMSQDSVDANGVSSKKAMTDDQPA